MLAVTMPSSVTARTSLRDAEDVAAALGIRQITLPMGDLTDTVTRRIAPVFGGSLATITRETSSHDSG